jgi:mRNA-degrading endonuclease toxin of MazEF toxin-antitoxin module
MTCSCESSCIHRTNYPIQIPATSIYRGDAPDRNRVRLIVEDESGNPISLSDFGTAWQAVAVGTGVSVTLTCTEEDTNTLSVAFPDAASTMDLPGSLLYDVQATGGEIDPFTVFRGTFTVQGEVTP